MDIVVFFVAQPKRVSSHLTSKKALPLMLRPSFV